MVRPFELPRGAADARQKISLLIQKKFKSIGKEAADQAVRAYSKVAKSDDPDTDQRVDEILTAVQSSTWSDLGIAMGPLLAVSAAASIAQAFADIQTVQPEYVPFQPHAHITAAIKPLFDAVNEQAASLALDRGAEMVGKRIVAGVLIDNPDARWTITEPTREWLRQDIVRAFEEGLSPDQLGELIRSSYAFSKARAELIARTEIGNLNVWSHAASAKAMGATHKASFLSADHDQDDFCDAAEEAGEVPIDHDYGGGLLWPLYHPRCQCSETFYWRKKKKPTVN